MHSSKPQQVRQRNFDSELYDGTCRPSFPFVKWIGKLIESMGASHIMDTVRHPDHIPSESLLLSKIAHETRAKESSDAFKEPTDAGKLGQSSGTPTWFSWKQWEVIGTNNELRTQLTILVSSQSSPSTWPPNQISQSMATKNWTKQRNLPLSNKRSLVKFWSQSRRDVNPASWTTPVLSFHRCSVFCKELSLRNHWSVDQ